MGALFSGGGDSKDMLPMMGALGAMGSMMGGGAGGGMMGLLPMLMMGLMGKDKDGKPSDSMRGQHDFIDRTGISRDQYKDVYGQKSYQQEINKQADQTGFMPSDYELMDKGYEGYGQTQPKPTVAPTPAPQQPSGVGMANNQGAGGTGTAAQKPFDLKGMATSINDMIGEQNKARDAQTAQTAQTLDTLKKQMANVPAGLMARPQGAMPTTPPSQGVTMGMQANAPSNAMQAIQGGMPSGVGFGAQPSVHEMMKRLYGQ